MHTDDLPDKENTTDRTIRETAIRETSIIVTKDRDFQDSFFLSKQPYKLLLIATGNIKNRPLLNLFTNNIAALAELFSTYSFIELNNTAIIIHE